MLATGYYDVPNLLNVPGEELDKVLHYYKEPHPYYNHDVAVIGAKNSAAIAALELYWTGARVTLIHRGAEDLGFGEVLDQAEYRKPHQERGDCGALQFQEWCGSPRIRSRWRRPTGRSRLQNDFVFALVGYRPDLEFLNATGISLEPDTQRPRTDPETLESTRPGIYLAGVIVAGMHTNEIFIENGRFHGHLIADSIASRIAPNTYALAAGAISWYHS